MVNSMEKDNIEDVYNKRKENILNMINDKDYIPLKFKEMCYLLQVDSPDRDTLLQILDELIDEGKIMRSSKGKYMKQDENVLSGVFTGNRKGFGFVTVEGYDEDFFISARNTGGAFHGDRVLIRKQSRVKGRRSEAAVIKVLTRGITQIVGTYDEGKGFGFVIPDSKRFDKDIFIPKSKSKGAVNGHKVVVKITSYGDNKKSPEGEILEIIGHITDPETDVMSVVRALDIPGDFPEEVMEYVENIPDAVTEKDIAGRNDLRDLYTITIDGEDAKDLDDAISLYEEGGIYKLGVHIADVTHYVTEGSPLDKEALNRGTSVYLVDRVIPMLPRKLSNGICSLNAGCDRLTLSCLMDVDREGHIINHNIVPSVINVNRRMSYTEVARLLDLKEDREGAPEITAMTPEEKEGYQDVLPMLKLMLHVSDIIRELRYERGSIDFDFDESKIKLDNDGNVTYVGVYEKTRANGIIEDFMLAANETIAEDYFWQSIPFEYRIHEAPDADRVKALSILINKFGYYFKASRDNIHPKEFQKLLQKISGDPAENLISRMTLRTMRQAKYSTQCSGHFGLACKYYCHFTSPIRRYPDLQIHRIIKENIRYGLNEKRREHYEKILPKVAADNSAKERRAEEAERQVEKLKKIEYMSRHIGETFTGIISGVINKGLFVELPNTVEGFIDVSKMYDDYYHFSEEEYAMVGENTKKRYAIGDTVEIKVTKADKQAQLIEFVLKMNKEPGGHYGKGKG